MHTFIKLILYVILLASISMGYTQETLYSDVTESAGIAHTTKHKSFFGGGVAWFDFDNDGYEDAYLTSGSNMDKLYKNNGDGTFTDIAEEAGFSETQYSYTSGVIAGDVDNDGYRDLFITNTNTLGFVFGPNFLFKNNGDGTFTNVWNQPQFKDGAWSSSAVFVDFNLDGLLDIYVGNYIANPNIITDENGNFVSYDHDCYENRFYINEGNFEFREATREVGLADTGCSLAMAATDYDLDGDMDIYLANDFGKYVEPNHMFVNNSDNQKFSTLLPIAGASIGICAMGIGVGDIDNDLNLDYYITNIGRNVLLKNNGNSFRDITDESNCSNEWVIQDSLVTTSWGAIFLDVDHDMDLDLVVSNGFLPTMDGNAAFDPNKLFINNGTGQFTETGAESGIEDMALARGMATSDYDLDGDLDLLINVLDQPLPMITPKSILYQNNATNGQNWIKVKLEGVNVNRDALGSKVYAYAGDQVMLREVSGGSSHASHNSNISHFGIGTVEIIDSIKVIWTGGKKSQTIKNVEANQLLYVKEDSTSSLQTNPIDLSHLYRISPNPAQNQIEIYGKIEKKTVVKIIGLDGKIWNTIKIPTSALSHKVDTKGYPNGIYHIHIYQKNSYAVKSVVILKN